MIKHDLASMYKSMSMSEEDRRTFDRWVTANLIGGAIFAAGFLVMALAASGSLGPGAAVAENNAAAVRASREGAIPGRPMSAYDLTIRMAPASLPVQQVDEPF